jgi:FRG domain
VPLNSSEITPSVVDSVGAVVEAVTAATDVHGRPLWYRGQHRVEWDLQASIHRDYTAEDERNFTNRFRSRAGMRYQHTPAHGDQAAWLSLMQHYGLPTRLVDWTRSPLIAAYFAVEPYISGRLRAAPDSDAVIWVLQPHRLNRLRGGTEVTPSINGDLCRPLLSPAFDHEAAEGSLVRAVMGSETDLRLFVQQGCFTIHCDRTPLNRMDGHAHFLHALVIPAVSVQRMADELDMCSFRQGDIFPDLGHLAAELRETHRPTG